MYPRGLLTAILLTSVGCSSSEFELAEAADSSVADSQLTDDTATPADTVSDGTTIDETAIGDAVSEIDTGRDATTATTNYARESGALIGAGSTNAGWPASRLVDGVLATSWFAANGACAGSSAPYTCGTDPATVTLKLAGDRKIGRVTIYGNREFPDGWDVLTARLELADAVNAKVFEQMLTFPAPIRDLTVSVPSVVARYVRVVIVTAESSAPGFAEIGVYGP